MSNANLNIEYEAMFCDIDVDSTRDKIRKLWNQIDLFNDKKKLNLL